jgi:hypothetical protein
MLSFVRLDGWQFAEMYLELYLLVDTESILLMQAFDVYASSYERTFWLISFHEFSSRMSFHINWLDIFFLLT